MTTRKLTLDQKLLVRILVQLMSHRQITIDSMRVQLLRAGLTNKQIDQEGFPPYENA